MNEGLRHQSLREMLGAYALGHLDPAEAERVDAHLDGCATCRTDLHDILPVARRLDDLDPAGFEAPPMPPADLAERIRAQVALESGARAVDDLAGRRRRHQVGPMVAAAAVLVALLVGGALGGWVGRTTAPTAAPVPSEPISLSGARAAGVTVESADLVAHTWGVELRIRAAGFADGKIFTAAFRTKDGALTPAGEFRGVGADSMTCFLQSAALREDVTQVVVTDQRGRTVLTSSL